VAYDAESIRQGLRDRRIIPFLAKRNTEHGSGLGRWRWVVERTLAESVPASAGFDTKSGGTFTRHSCPGVYSDLLVLPPSRLAGGLKLSFARNALTRHSLAS
jgi:hypothetical protein